MNLTTHRAGCSHTRTGRCICTYLAQWDNAPKNYTAPTFRESALTVDPDKIRRETLTAWPASRPPLTPEDLMDEIDALRTELTRTELTLTDAAKVSAANTRARCTNHPYSWHYAEGDRTCAQFDKELLGVDGFSELALHPLAAVKHAATVSNRMVHDAKQETSDEQLRSRYWHKEYENLDRRFTGVLILGAAGWALAVARGIWGF